MKMSKMSRNLCAFFMALLISNVPAVAASESVVSGKMISTEAVLQDLSRDQAEVRVKMFLNSLQVKRVLLARGLDSEEISSRLASLSDSELRDLTVQVEEARYGGDILVAILLVVLIIYFVKRI